MHERMLDKNNVPNEDDIKNHIGEKSVGYIEIIKKSLEKIFDINMELKFPFGNNYGWGYKVSNKSKHLFYIFFEKNSISIMLQIKKIVNEKKWNNIVNYLKKVKNTGKKVIHVEKMEGGFIIGYYIKNN